MDDEYGKWRNETFQLDIGSLDNYIGPIIKKSSCDYQDQHVCCKVQTYCVYTNCGEILNNIVSWSWL